MMYGYEGFGGGGLYMGFIWIIFWGAVIYFVIQLLHQTNTNKNGKNHIDILKERYAKGEITKKEFEEMKKDLI